MKYLLIIATLVVVSQADCRNITVTDERGNVHLVLICD